LNTLWAFWAVMRYGGLVNAARELHVSPQAVGQSIKHLENILQVQLFERTQRSLHPNKEAELLFHYVDAGLDELSYGLRQVDISKRRLGSQHESELPGPESAARWRRHMRT
ncbi:LysR family transcriptional regulator, partial [Mesorhizobium waimense]